MKVWFLRRRIERTYSALVSTENEYTSVVFINSRANKGDPIHLLYIYIYMFSPTRSHPLLRCSTTALARGCLGGSEVWMGPPTSGTERFGIGG